MNNLPASEVLKLVLLVIITICIVAIAIHGNAFKF